MFFDSCQDRDLVHGRANLCTNRNGKESKVKFLLLILYSTQV